MEEQLLEIDSIGDLRVALEDSVGSDAAVIVGEVPPERPEGAVGRRRASRPEISQTSTTERHRERQTVSPQRQVRLQVELMVFLIVYPSGLCRLG